MLNKLEKKLKSGVSGFTLIELLVVIGIIAILAALVLVAVNPARQFAQARNTQRTNDVYQLVNAVYQYSVENNGEYPTALQGTTVASPTNATALAGDLVPTYIPQLPADPTTGSSDDYVIFLEPTEVRVTASASAAELDETITVTR